MIWKTNFFQSLEKLNARETGNCVVFMLSLRLLETLAHKKNMQLIIN